MAPSGILLLVAMVSVLMSLVLENWDLFGFLGIGLLSIYFPYRSLRERQQTLGDLKRTLNSLGEIELPNQDELRKQLSEFEEVASQLKKETLELKHDTSTFSGRSYLPSLFDRRITEENMKLIIENWSDPLELEIQPEEIRYMERRIVFLEGVCRGRIATTSTDVVIRALAARSLKKENERASFLEIGTLFGLGAFILHDLFSGVEGCHLTLIDPLDGYYGNTTPDPITGLVVSEKLLWENADRLGIQREEVTLLKGWSTDGNILASTRTGYELLVIDGDHSYEGIKSDFELYAGKVNSGGLLVVDDYEFAVWPDVKRYTDETIRNDERFQFLGAQSRTAVFRRL
tara:strand:- start:199 stop:1233 length:1035 start_codon:yes stop_codon:yes gene_type:complete